MEVDGDSPVQAMVEDEAEGTGDGSSGSSGRVGTGSMMSDGVGSISSSDQAPTRSPAHAGSASMVSVGGEQEHNEGAMPAPALPSRHSSDASQASSSSAPPIIFRTAAQHRRWNSIPDHHKRHLPGTDCDEPDNAHIPKVCFPCFTALVSKATPRFCSMTFPAALPEVDALTHFEERLVCINQPFAYICEAPQRQNMVQKGNMVLVHNNIAKVHERLRLPRTWDEHSTLPTDWCCNLNRDLRLERAWKCGVMRPWYVVRALEALMPRPLYALHGVQQRQDWERVWREEEEPENLEEAPAVRVDLVVCEGEGDAVRVVLRVPVEQCEGGQRC